jgi:putative tryptophan/tyrosine transport system substrate-binding protein
MQRRDFIKLVAGSVVTWPLAAGAQQPSMPVIGFLNVTSPDAYRLRAFHQGLKEAGFVEGENVAVEYRWADNQIDRLQTLAAELVRRQVTLIVAGGGFRSSLAAKTETKSIPVLFVAGEDPVARSCHQPRKAGRQPDRDQYPGGRGRDKATGTPA